MNHKLDEAQAGINIVRKNTNNLRYADDNTLMAESEQELKNLLMKMKEEWKSWLKTQHPKNEVHVIWSHHFMKNRWETMEIVRDFIFLGSKITVDSDCSHKIKTLAPWKKSHDKPRQCIKKQRDYFANKCPYGQTMIFSTHVQMWKLNHKEG